MPASSDGRIADTVLGAPVPRPSQSFGIGLNYRDHAGESGMTLPPAPQPKHLKICRCGLTVNDGDFS